MKKFLTLSLLFISAIAFAYDGNDVKLFYDQNGNLYNGQHITYHENGIKKTDFTIQSGKIVGTAKFFYESGELMESGNYSDGLKDGAWTKYSKTGGVIGVASFKSGEKDGQWLIFNNQGKKLFEMYYTNGERSGTWKQWDEKGNLISEKSY